MRVAILTPSASRNAGGLYNSVRRGAIEMHRLGVQIQVFAPEDRNCTVDLPFWSPVNVSLYRALGPAKFGFHFGLRQQVRASAPDVIHLHGLWTFQSTVSHAVKMPVVISPRGMLDAWALKNSQLKKKIAHHLFEAENLRIAKCIHALNCDEAAAIRDLGIKAPVAIIPNGIDPPEATSLAPPEWIVGCKRKVLLFLGRIHPKKGVSELLQAWSTVRENSPEIARSWRLVVAGWDDGGYINSLRSLAAQLHIEDDVIFPGPVYHEDKIALLSHSDAFILPSYSEGLPMSVLEAWAYGLPVFMTRQCNLSFAFAEGAAIEITTQPEEIAASLVTWLRQERKFEVGARGRAIAAQRFGWGGIASQQIEMYDWLLGNRARPDFINLHGPS